MKNKEKHYSQIEKNAHKCYYYRDIRVNKFFHTDVAK